MNMEAFEVLERLLVFEEVEEALEVDKKVKREFSLEKNLSWKKSLFPEIFLFLYRFFSFSLDICLFTIVL